MKVWLESWQGMNLVEREVQLKERDRDRSSPLGKKGLVRGKDRRRRKAIRDSDSR
jgi:hypothetical protein